ncbi:MAG: NAD(P)-binding protein [Actinomycetota bacterium]|nr:NAD(P)-binding protein [Actinomycetota bacterium]
MEKEVVVAGAGLSGLTAALNLARDGCDVTVIEKYEKIGGVPTAHPAVDVTPLEEDKLGRFIEAELKKPQVNPCERWNIYAYGQKVPMDCASMNLKCIQRGSHKESLDMLLYKLCVEAGVKFEFGKPLVSQGDFAELPPDSIVATGLYFEAFEGFNIPYQKVFGYIGRGKAAGSTCGVWFHDYTLDYAYYGTAGGNAFCLYFAREPVKEKEWEDFKEKHLLGEEGLECTRWDYHEGLVPVASFSNPRLFAADKILAGTLSGMMDPFALFGVHGSLASGKIAAIAHRDKAAAYDLFVKYTKYFKRNLLLRRLFDGTPIWLKKMALGRGIAFSQRHVESLKGQINRFFMSIPGYNQL